MSGKIVTGIVGGIIGGVLAYSIIAVLALAALFNQTPEYIVMLQMLVALAFSGAVGYGIYAGLNYLFNV